LSERENSVLIWVFKFNSPLTAAEINLKGDMLKVKVYEAYVMS
jgi:hypothetical protein